MTDESSGVAGAHPAPPPPARRLRRRRAAVAAGEQRSRLPLSARLELRRPGLRGDAQAPPARRARLRAELDAGTYRGSSGLAAALVAFLALATALRPAHRGERPAAPAAGGRGAV